MASLADGYRQDHAMTTYPSMSTASNDSNANTGADAQDGFSLGSDASLGGFVWGDYEIRRSTRVRVPVQYIYDPLEETRKTRNSKKGKGKGKGKDKDKGKGKKANAKWGRSTRRRSDDSDDSDDEDDEDESDDDDYGYGYQRKSSRKKKSTRRSSSYEDLYNASGRLRRSTAARFYNDDDDESDESLSDDFDDEELSDDDDGYRRARPKASMSTVATTSDPLYTIDRVLDCAEFPVEDEPGSGERAEESGHMDSSNTEALDQQGDAMTDKSSVKPSPEPSTMSGTIDASSATSGNGPRTVRKYLIKWLWAPYRENTWNTEEELTRWGVAGLKKVANFKQKAEEREEFLRTCTEEEKEQADVALELHREQIAASLEPERVIAVREELLVQVLQRQIACKKRAGGGVGPHGTIPEEEEDIETLIERYPGAVHTVAGRSGAKAYAVTMYLVKWCELGYEDCTWETAESIGNQKLIDDFLNRELMLPGAQTPATASRAFTKFTVQPAYLGGDQGESELDSAKAAESKEDDANSNADRVTKFLAGRQLRRYQLDGLNWLIHGWCHRINGILADEMGLGKTVQCVCLLSHLFHERRIPGPFLLVVPLSTIHNWYRELRKWAPALNTILYVGNSVAREALRQFEFYCEDTQSSGRGKPKRRPKFHVLLTTYEYVIKDKPSLQPIDWAYLLVDEAHRLKDHRSQLYRTLEELKSDARLLVTGTPLQNSIRELWSLLHFLHPEKFDSLEAFEEEFGGIRNEEQIKKLHSLLQPHLLRRVKRDVLKMLPTKTERIVRVDLCTVQKRVYRMVLTRNFRELNRGAKSGRASLTNIVMELKKCCNHPSLFGGTRFETREEAIAATHQQAATMQWVCRREAGPENAADTNNSNPISPTNALGGGAQVAVVAPNNRLKLADLVRRSGKLALLDRMLCRLFETGHRVLIFSQMVKMLDVLSEYMTLRGFSFQRLDGGMKASDRQLAMDRFNSPQSRDFAFLLSTRAGGLGINLATADTVIIFDSDWNPQNDLQAAARSHRLGQRNSVNVYRMVTRDTVEEKILDKAKKKMILDHLIIQRMDTSGASGLGMGGSGSGATMFDAKELHKILQFGAANLFSDTSSAAPKTADDTSSLALQDEFNQEHAEPSENAASDTAAFAGHDSVSLAPGPALLSIDIDSLLARDNSVEQNEAEEDDAETRTEDQTEAFLAAFKVADLTNRVVDPAAAAKAAEAAARAKLKEEGIEDVDFSEDSDEGDDELFRKLIPISEIPQDQIDIGGGLTMPVYLAPRKRVSINVDDSSDEDSDSDQESESGEGTDEERITQLSGRATQKILRALMAQGSVERAMAVLRMQPWSKRRESVPPGMLDVLHDLVKACEEAMVIAEQEEEKEAKEQGKDLKDVKRKAVAINFMGMEVLASEIVQRMNEMSLLVRLIETDAAQRLKQRPTGLYSRLSRAASLKTTASNAGAVSQNSSTSESFPLPPNPTSATETNASEVSVSTTQPDSKSDAQPTSSAPTPAPPDATSAQDLSEIPPPFDLQCELPPDCLSMAAVPHPTSDPAIFHTIAASNPADFPLASFRLRCSLPPARRWDPAVAEKWGVAQDSMLMVGVYIHGMNAIDAIIRDPRLGLYPFLFVEKTGEANEGSSSASPAEGSDSTSKAGAASSDPTAEPAQNGSTDATAEMTASTDAEAKPQPPSGDPSSVSANSGEAMTDAPSQTSKTHVEQAVRTQLIANRCMTILRELLNREKSLAKEAREEAEREAAREAKARAKKEAQEQKRLELQAQRAEAKRKAEEEKQREREQRKLEKELERKAKQEEKAKAAESKDDKSAKVRKEPKEPKESKGSKDGKDSKDGSHDSRDSKESKPSKLKTSKKTDGKEQSEGDDGKSSKKGDQLLGAKRKPGAKEESEDSHKKVRQSESEDEVPTIQDEEGNVYKLDEALIASCKSTLDAQAGAIEALRGMKQITKSDDGWETPENRKLGRPFIICIGNIIVRLMQESYPTPESRTKEAGRVEAHFWHYAGMYAGRSGRKLKKAYQQLIEKMSKE